MSLRLVQLYHETFGRRIALVEEEKLDFLATYTSIYQLVMHVLRHDLDLKEMIMTLRTSELVGYEKIYTGNSEWKILPSFDHPEDPSMCMLSGTGLTHKASAADRDNMHAKQAGGDISDSMKIYLWGEEGGKPQEGTPGVQPEWFYKGNGSNLKAHGDLLSVPVYGNDGGEEPEVAGIYVVNDQGEPFRVGFTAGNEFSDHVMEKKNYLYLAPSKLRECSIGPELIVNGDFKDIPGKVWINRDGKRLWSKNIKTGEENITHSLENLEHHHFKYDQHRLPGMAHIHFFGADGLSFGEGISLKEGDEMVVEWGGFGKPLRNKLSVKDGDDEIVRVKTF